MTTSNWRIVLLGLCLKLPHISSLSSHSPPDPFAHPKYSVRLFGWEDAINNQTASEILLNLQSDSKSNQDSLINPNFFSPNDEPNVRHTLMRTASGQAFLCALPPLPLPSPPTSSNSHQSNTNAVDSASSAVEELERRKERDLIEQEGLKNGLNLISSLKDRCIYTRLGWFTYSFCYGKGEIRQFHAQVVPGYNFPQEDPNQDTYVLGFHIDHPQNPHHQARTEGTLPAPTLSAGEGELTSLGRNRFASSGASLHGSISDVLRDESAIRSSAAKEEEEFQQKRYLVQRWDGGTICDMTGKPRSVEVQFHCSTLGSDHIALLRETTICEYLLVIHTPALCSEPLFLDGGSRIGIGAGETATNIGCQPVLTDEEIDKWKANEELRKKKKQQEENAQNLKSLEETPSVHETRTESKGGDHPDTVSQGSSVKQAQSNIPSSEKVSDVPQTQDESVPISSPDQIVLGGTESTAGQATGKKNSGSKPDEKPSQSKNKPEILEVDPITVYFDTDSGKMYLDYPTIEEGSSGSRSESGTQSGTTTDEKNNNNQATQSEPTERKINNQPDAGLDSESEFREIAKALKESFSALLKDLRADDEANNNNNNDPNRRLNQNSKGNHPNKPRSLAEVLASLKELDPSLSSSGSSNKKIKLKNNLDDHSKTSSWQDIKKLSTESHSKLVEMYQSKFNSFETSPDSHQDQNQNQNQNHDDQNHINSNDDHSKKDP